MVFTQTTDGKGLVYIRTRTVPRMLACAVLLFCEIGSSVCCGFYCVGSYAGDYAGSIV
jgi:hypothetical protein